MYSEPDLSEIREIAKSLGIHVSDRESEVYRKALIENLRSLDKFVQSRVAEEKPHSGYGMREFGYRPDGDEDALNAWLWKCLIPGRSAGVLSGKTVSFKDHISVAGIPLTFGVFDLDGFIPDFDATVVVRVLDAGGTVVGKNTMMGFTGGFGLGDTRGDYWPPRNPHAWNHLTGGTSSGSAVAVVDGDVDIAFGGDQGGSVRIPAAWTGCVGLKPTFGLISHFGAVFGTDQSLDHIGPMARTVEEVAAALDAVGGYDGLDPRQGRNVPDRVNVRERLGDGIAGVRLGLLEEGFAGVDEDVKDIVESAAELLAKNGATVVRISIDEHLRANEAALALIPEGALAIFRGNLFGSFHKTWYPTSTIAAVNRFWHDHADLLSPWIKLQYLTAEFSRRYYYGRVYAKAQNVRTLFVRAYDAALAEVDLLVMPTCCTTAPAVSEVHGTGGSLIDDLTIPTGISAIRNTLPFDYTGHPALAMPCGKSNGLPVSMQLVGRCFEEEVLLRVAYAFQHSVDYDEIISVRK